MNKFIMISILALFAINVNGQNIDIKLPSDFKNLVTQKDYENIIDLCRVFQTPARRF